MILEFICKSRSVRRHAQEGKIGLFSGYGDVKLNFILFRANNAQKVVFYTLSSPNQEEIILEEIPQCLEHNQYSVNLFDNQLIVKKGKSIFFRVESKESKKEVIVYCINGKISSGVDLLATRRDGNEMPLFLQYF